MAFVILGVLESLCQKITFRSGLKNKIKTVSQYLHRSFQHLTFE